MKKKLLTVFTVTVFIALGIAAYTVFSNPSRQSDAVIRQQFDCDRATDDYRSTDVYCTNPDKYREDVENNTLVRE